MPADSTLLYPEKSQNAALCFHQAHFRPAERAAALGAWLGAVDGTDAAAIALELVDLASSGAFPGPARVPRRRRWLDHRASGADFATAIAVRALVNHWSKFPLQVREAALAVHRSQLLATIERCGESAGATLSAARLIHDDADPALLNLAGNLLLAPEPRTVDAAADAVLRIACRVAGEQREFRKQSDWPPAAWRALAPEDRRVAIAGLARIMESFEAHRREETLAAAMLLLDPTALAWGGRSGGNLAQWFVDREHAGQAALRGALRRPGPAIWRRRAWEWLGRDAVAAAALDRVGRAASVAEHEAVLERAHLIECPARRWRVGLIDVKPAIRGRARAHSPLPDSEQLKQATARARRGLPRLAAVCRISPALLERTLEPLLADPDPTVRFAAQRALPAVVGDYCFDPDPRVAKTAVLRWVHEAHPSQWGERAGMLGLLVRSPHAQVRAIAADEGVAVDPWNPDCDRSRLAGRRILRADRPGFVAELRRRLAGDDEGQTLAAIAMARWLRLESEIELELLAILGTSAGPELGSRPAVLQATAVAALGSVTSASARAAIRACLNHPVDRVRANAIEAIVRPRRDDTEESTMDPVVYAVVIERSDDAHHRVRANALRGLSLASNGAEPAAADGLVAMLGDNRPLHRLAGLWAIERVLIGPGAAAATSENGWRRWKDLTARVADLASSEPEGPVRVRAVRCAGAVLARMRSGWRDRAVAVGAEEGAAA